MHRGAAERLRAAAGTPASGPEPPWSDAMLPGQSNRPRIRPTRLPPRSPPGRHRPREPACVPGRGCRRRRTLVKDARAKSLRDQFRQGAQDVRREEAPEFAELRAELRTEFRLRSTDERAHNLEQRMSTYCPKCKSADPRRSQTRLWELPLKFLTRRRPHRCRECGWRGWTVSAQSVDTSAVALAADDEPADPDFSALDEGAPPLGN